MGLKAPEGRRSLNRTEIVLVLCGAAATVLLIAIYGFIRSLILRHRGKRKTAQAWREPMPEAEHSAFAEIRKEIDTSHRRLVWREESEARRRIEAQLAREGKSDTPPPEPPEDLP
jgi:hypothetical protein